MYFKGHQRGPEAVDQVEKPGAPERKRVREREKDGGGGVSEKGGENKRKNNRHMGREWDSQLVSLPLNSRSVKREVFLGFTGSREHAQAGWVDRQTARHTHKHERMHTQTWAHAHTQLFYKQALIYWRVGHSWCKSQYPCHTKIVKFQENQRRVILTETPTRLCLRLVLISHHSLKLSDERSQLC